MSRHAHMLTAHERLVEWGKSLHREPWNYWPRCSVLGRVREEGAGASQGTSDDTPDGGMAAMMDRLGWGIDKDRRCAEVMAAVYAMPLHLRAIVDATYRCAGKREVPRSRQGSLAVSGLTADEYDDRMDAMLQWLSDYLCISQEAARA